MTFTHPPGSKPLPGYSIKRGIGRGAFGEVYYAVSDGGKDVALKLIQQHVEVELRGVRECLNLEHPNLVRLYDVQQTPEGKSWVVMEYCDGESLEEAIAAHPNGMPVDEVLQWFRGICGGVGFLHDHGIVHRDLKPSHIFRENGVIKICDYGLAKFISVSRRSGNTDGVGTVFYAAPEMAKGKYGKELDLYSLGVMLYEALSGDVPFDGETAAEILMKHLAAKPDVSHFPAPYKQIVSRLLEKDPQRRFRSVEELTQTFDAPITAKPASGGVLDRFPIVGRLYNKVQPKRRIGQLFGLVKRNKLASFAICGACAMMMAIGISIGEANRRYYRGNYPTYSIPSSSSLSRIQVKRNDGSANTIRLAEIASFGRVDRGSRRSAPYHRYPAYRIVVDGQRSQAVGVGNREILEALWDSGYAPTIEIDVNQNEIASRKITTAHINAMLQSFVAENETRRSSCRVDRTSNGFTLQFRRTSNRRNSGGIVDFYLMKPEAVFNLDLKSQTGASNARIPLRNVATLRIVACNPR